MLADLVQHLGEVEQFVRFFVAYEVEARLAVLIGVVGRGEAEQLEPAHYLVQLHRLVDDGQLVPGAGWHSVAIAVAVSVPVSVAVPVRLGIAAVQA